MHAECTYVPTHLDFIREGNKKMKRIRSDIAELKENRISDKLKREFRRRYGEKWKNYADLVRIVEEQRRIEDKALSVWKQELEKGKSR